MAKKKSKINDLLKLVFPNSDDLKIRDLKLNMSKTVLIAQEGDDYDEMEEGERIYLIYYHEINDGITVELECGINTDEKLVDLNYFLRYNLYENEEDQESFDGLIKEVLERLENGLGQAEKKIVEDEDITETHFIWKMKDENPPEEIYLIHYLEEDPEDSDYNDLILKIVHTYSE